MAEDKVQIYKVDTTDAVKSVNDLKENISLLKKQIGDLGIGTEEYQKKLTELQTNQKALRDAMYATTSTMEDVATSAKGLGVVFDKDNKLVKSESVSYNALVNTMASLKTEWRATSDVVRRAELGERIDQVNNQLKTLDASTGNFSRNVGNYQSVFKGFADKTDAFGKGLKITKGGVDGLKNGFEGIAKSPAIGTFAILVSVFGKIASELEENETMMEALKKAMNSLKPVMDFLGGIVEKVATFLGDIIGKVSEFIVSNGIFDKVIKGVMGIGNAIVQYVTAPFKGVIEAIKVFKEKGVKGFGEAGKAFLQEMKSGVSFKSNFEAGQTMADTIISGAKSKKKEVESAGAEMGESFADAINAAFEKGQKISNERLTNYLNDLKEFEKLAEEDLKELTAEIDEMGAEVTAGILDNIKAELQAEAEAEAERARLEEADKARAELRKERWIESAYAVADATSSILSTIADMYEEDEENAKKNENKVKALRISSAVIDTISGALTAFAQAQQLGPIAGPIVGAINAAAVTATGVAQIAKIKKTKVGDAGASASGGVSASVSAPSVNMQVDNVRTLTSASEEDRLNRMASEQKVYILSSDIEASQTSRKVQVAEASF